MSIRENTEIIAEFMGIVFNKNEDAYYNNGHKIQSILNFYRSWDWLMPVVEKIKQVNGDYPKELNNVSLFSKKREVLTRLKELNKPFIMIIPTCLLSLKWFQKLYSNQIQIIIPMKRLTFTKLNEISNGYTPPFGSFIYCYKMNLEKDLIFLK